MVRAADRERSEALKCAGVKVSLTDQIDHTRASVEAGRNATIGGPLGGPEIDGHCPILSSEHGDMRGDDRAFGAPSAVRGCSLICSVGCGDLVPVGLCDMLTATYECPALLATFARLEWEVRSDLSSLWSSSSGGPARAMGPPDRGATARVKHVDPVRVHGPRGGTQAVRGTSVPRRAANGMALAG